MTHLESEPSERLRRDEMEGRVLNQRYEIVLELGRGGRGVVYLAHDRSLDREVAIKMVLNERLSGDDEARFAREARAAAKLDHPSIVAIYDFGRFDLGMFLVMPYVRGDNLRVAFERGMSPTDIVKVVALVAEALEDCHRQGIVHRDIKPENIMLQQVQTDAAPRIKLVDFGLALDLAKERLTQQGMLVGTLAYLSPEQVSAEGLEVSAATDVYSLAVVLYEGLTGVTPFTGDWQKLLYQIAFQQPKPPNELGVALDEALEGLLLRCLSKMPEDRPSAGHMAATLLQLGAELSPTRRPPSASLEAQPISNQPFVARRLEMAELENRLEAAREGECQLVLVGGETGSGKTALMEQVRELASRHDVRCLSGGFIDPSQGIFVYQGYCEALLDGLRQRHAKGLTPGHELESLAPELLRLLPGITSLPGIDDLALQPESQTLTGRPPRRKRHLFETLARTLALVGEGEPLILILEGLHCADVSVEALHYLFRRLGPTPLLIVGTYQSEEVDRQHPLVEMLFSLDQDPRIASLRLAPLNPLETRQLVEGWLETWLPQTSGSAAEMTLDDAALRLLHETTGGNPLHVRELLRGLLQDGGLRPDETGRWQVHLHGEMTVPSLPGSVRLALQRRLASLAPEKLEILSVASVLGLRFELQELAAVQRADLPESLLGALINEGFLEPVAGRDGVLAHNSMLLRHVLYEQLSARRRRILHRRLAHHLEAFYGDKVSAVCGRLSRHFALAEEAKPALRYGLMAARQAIDAHCPEDAVRALQLLLDFVDDEEEGLAEDAVAADVHGVLAEALSRSDRPAEALRQVDKAVVMLQRLGQPAPLPLLWTAARSALDLQRYGEAWKYIAQGLEHLDSAAPDVQRRFLRLGGDIQLSLGQPQRAAELRRRADGVHRGDGPDLAGVSDTGSGYAERLGDLLLVQGDYLAARDAFRAAREEERRSSGGLDPRDEAQYLARMAELALKLGRYDKALEHCQRGMELVGSKDEVMVAGLQALAGRVECSAGHYQRAALWVDRGLALVSKGAPLDRARRHILAQLLRTQGSVLVGEGRPQEAVAVYDQSRQHFEALEDRWEHSIALFNLAESLIAAGDHGNASGYLKAALKEKSAIGDRWGMAYTQGAWARIHLDRGEEDGAERAVRAGLELVEHLDDPKIVARLWVLSGRLHLLKGELDDAEGELQGALIHAERTAAGPEMIHARLGLAAVYLERGLFHQARVTAEWAYRESLEAANHEGLLVAALTLGRLDHAVGRFAEASRWLMEALERAERVGNAYRLCEVLSLLGRNHLLRGRHRRARQDFERMGELAQQAGDVRLICMATLGKAEISLMLEEEEDTLSLAQQALQASRKLAIPSLMGSVYELLTRHFVQVARHRKAETYANAALQIYSSDREGNARRRGRLHLFLAEMHRSAGQFEAEAKDVAQALELLENSGDQAAWLDAQRTSVVLLASKDPQGARAALAQNLQSAEEAGYLLGQAQTLSAQSELLRRLGEIEAALECTRKEEHLLRRLAHQKWLSINAFHYATLYFEQGDYGQALHSDKLNFRLRDNVGTVGQLYGLELRGLLLSQVGRFADARGVLDRAQDLARQLDHTWRLANVHLARAELFLVSGDLNAARDEQDQGLALGGQISDSQLLWSGYLVNERLRVSMARLALAQGRTRHALDCLEAPLRTFQELNTPLEWIDAELVLALIQLQLGAPRTACEVLGEVASRSRALGLWAREADALYLLARSSSDLNMARRSYRLAVRTGSWLRMARAAKLESELMAQRGLSPGDLQPQRVADSLFQRLRQEVEPPCRRAAEAYWRNWGQEVEE